MVSMSGGLEFFIDGAGFDELPTINSVMFEPTQTEPNLFAGPALNSKLISDLLFVGHGAKLF